MQALEVAFPRMKDRPRHDEQRDRFMRLQCMVLLHNYRVHYVGLNQIPSTDYFPYLAANPEELLSYIYCMHFQRVEVTQMYLRTLSTQASASTSIGADAIHVSALGVRPVVLDYNGPFFIK